MGKKLCLLFFALALLLSGCSGEALLVKEATLKAFEEPAMQFRSTLSLQSDIARLKDETNLDPVAEKILALLRAGITVEGTQVDLQNVQFSLTVNDDSLLREMGWWKGNEKPALQLIVANEEVYVKSSADRFYLKFDNGANGPGEDAPFDPEEMRKFQRELNELFLRYYQEYIKTYSFELKNVKREGKQTVRLPNGEQVEAEKITITLDTKEIYRFLLFTLKDMANHPLTKQLLADLQNLFAKYAHLTQPPSGEGETGEPFPGMETVLPQLPVFLNGLAAQMETKPAEQWAKELGLENSELIFTYYIDRDKHVVKGETEINVTLKNEKLGQPLSFTLSSEEYRWGFGKKLELPLPDADEVVTLQELLANPDKRNLFDRNGFLYPLIDELTKETLSVVFHVQEGSTYVNGAPVDGVRAHLSKGTTMVPFRFLGETIGAEVAWDPKTKTAIFKGEGTEIKLTVGAKTAIVNGQPQPLSSPAELKDGKVFVPLAFVSRNFGGDVTWLPDEKIALLEFVQPR
ncbi:hypothetical protein BSNK01_26930 [Bacillaceae bacterium]